MRKSCRCDISSVHYRPPCSVIEYRPPDHMQQEVFPAVSASVFFVLTAA